MYRVTQTGKRATRAISIEHALNEANDRIADWPKPFNDMRNHHQFHDFKRYAVHQLAVRHGSGDTVVTIDRSW